MKPTHHMLYVRANTKCINKLQETMLATFIKLDRTLVLHEDVDQFKKDLIELANAINTKFPRCKPVKSDWWEVLSHDGKTKALGLNGLTFMDVKLYACRLVEGTILTKGE